MAISETGTSHQNLNIGVSKPARTKYAGVSQPNPVPQCQESLQVGLTLNRWLPALLFLSALPGSGLLAEESTIQPPPIKENTLMFYYKDLAVVTPFYEKTLGLTKTYDQDWVKIFQLTPSSSIGLVQEGEASFHRAQKDNAVMLSIVTEDVDAWYQRIKQTPGIVFLKDIYNNENVPIRAFLVEDPGGYSIEFFQWLAVEK
jgi:predicted enzyme related to lactoylglutathione lyase